MRWQDLKANRLRRAIARSDRGVIEMGKIKRLPARFYGDESSPRQLQRRLLAILAAQVEELERATLEKRSAVMPSLEQGEWLLRAIKTLTPNLKLMEDEELDEQRAVDAMSDDELTNALEESAKATRPPQHPKSGKFVKRDDND